MTFQDLRHTSPKNHILPLSERESALFDAKPQAGNNKKMTSQVCISQSWDILTMALLYTLSLADPQTLFSSSAVISSTGRTMCGKAMAPR